MKIERTNIRLYADPKKVLLRYLNFGLNPKRIDPIVSYVLSLSENELKDELARLNQEFAGRHKRLMLKFQENFDKISSLIKDPLTENQQYLIGSYFTSEYSVQAAALFNPSIVAHPNQENTKYGGLRFILTLRATGEGHISSIAFQTGEICNEGNIKLNEPSSQISSGHCEQIEDTYTVKFKEESPISSRILFPFLDEESMGMEDARFVKLLNSEYKYAATYTAYNGVDIKPKLILTQDFTQFTMCSFQGKVVGNKGFALFPRKIKDNYVMIGRQDGRNLSIMFSKDLIQWDKFKVLQQPQRGWEMLQIGNNGSPIETKHGWLLLTHGVGPMRKYTLGMTLLDLEDPTKVLATLDEPMMSPNEEEREGYVPNVLYTCGMIEWGGILYIPYAMSDSAISFAKVSIVEILKKMNIRSND